MATINSLLKFTADKINTLQTQMASQFKFKGSCTYANLPSSGMAQNDTWYVTDRKYMMTYNGTAWYQSGVDESAYSYLLSNMADSFSASSTYAVGDYVVYSGQLYRCTTAITTAEAWTAGHWTAVTFGEEVGKIKEGLTDVCDNTINLKDAFSNLAVGTLTGSDRHYDSSTKNRVSSTSKITAKRKMFIKNVNDEFRIVFFCYNASGELFQEKHSTNGNTLVINAEEIFNVMIFRATEIEGEIADINEFSKAAKVYAVSEVDIKYLKENSKGTILNNIKEIEWYKSAGINSTYGYTYEDSGKFCTDFIFCPTNAIVNIDIPSGYIARLYAYDLDFDYLKGAMLLTWSERHNFKVKLNNKYLRVSVSRSDYTDIDYSVHNQCHIYVDNTANVFNSFKIKDYISSQNSIPSYWNTHLANAVSTINSRISDITNYDQFIFITDLHINQGNSGRYGDLIDYVVRNTSVNKVICGGDMFTGLEGLKERCGADYLLECGFKLSRNPYVKYLYALGNHDDGEVYDSSGGLASKLINSVFDIYKYAQIEYSDNIQTDIYSPSRYCYTDNDKKMIYIFLDNTMPGTTGESYNNLNLYNQTWLYKTLMSIPSGYTPVIVTHIVWLNSQSEYTYDTSEWMAKNIICMASAYNNKTTIILASVEYDFTSAVGCKVPLIQSGHTHLDTNTTYDGINVVATTCDSWQQASPVGNNGRAVGDTTENAFDVVTIDKDNSKIYHDRIGAGHSREFTFTA